MRKATHTRRSMIGGTLGLGAAAALARTGLAQDASPEASPMAGGEWSFTDDKGVTITLPAAPQRVVIDVNAAAPLWDYGVRPVGVFGWLANPSGDFGEAGGNIDASSLEIIGNGEETINVEALVGLQPDLLITLTFAPEDPDEYWSLAADGPLEQVRQVVPILAISGVKPDNITAGRFAELAQSLGADLSAPEVVADHERWLAAEESFKAVLAEKPGISAVYIAPSPDMYYVVNPAVAGDASYARSLGLTIPDVTIDEANGTYWEYLSPEEVGKYQTDLLFVSYRATLSIEEFIAIPTVAALPAVQAGQVFEWNQDSISSYRGLADGVEGLIAAVSSSEIVTG